MEYFFVCDIIVLITKESILSELATKIKQLRIDHNMTQQQVADALNIDRSNYSKYELGKLSISVEMLKELCVLYSVSADFLLGLCKI